MRLALLSLLLLTVNSLAQIPDGYWAEDQSQAILDSTLRITLDPDLSHLSEGEARAVTELIAAGRIIDELYELQLHRQSPAARQALLKLHESTGQSPATRNLIDLWHLSHQLLSGRYQPPGARQLPGGESRRCRRAARFADGCASCDRGKPGGR
jgi:hypothetical protein